MGKYIKIKTAAVVLTGLAWMSLHAAAQTCTPTTPDMLGPFYKEGAPVRSSVGAGYVLTGTVRSSADCNPVSNAKIEFWLVGPNGQYDDEHRATLYSGNNGEYKFESNIPKPYSGRPPHIHVMVMAEGFSHLITQHYPEEGVKSASWDLVLIPSAQKY
ncbi:MAG: intradiol ring-cleavage dioxygenase [Nitrospiraceae bacterium]|nr:MAG: intradiol ring-cleavage dioxygenase [Nitrospiraceae bacterium]